MAPYVINNPKVSIFFTYLVLASYLPPTCTPSLHAHLPAWWFASLCASAKCCVCVSACLPLPPALWLQTPNLFPRINGQEQSRRLAATMNRIYDDFVKELNDHVSMALLMSVVGRWVVGG